MAPSASAAAALAGELGIATENTAKWLHEAAEAPGRLAGAARLRALAEALPGHLSSSVTEAAAANEAEAERWRLHAGEQLAVDEAGLASTLDRLATQAREAGGNCCS